MSEKITWKNETRKLQDLKPWERNPRYIKKDEAERLEDSLDYFGQIQALAIGPDDTVYDGHQRKAVWAAAQKYGPDYEVDVRVASRKLTEKEREKLTVYLHRGTVAEWNWEELANSFENMELLEWGFTENELLGNPANVEFKEYDESVADEVKYVECPECGHKFPK